VADLSAVLSGWVSLISGVAYPNGTSQPSIVAPNVVKVGYGWPMPGQLDADLLSANPPVTVSVWPLPGDRDVTRFERTLDLVGPKVNPTVTATVAGATVTLSGTATAGNYVTIVAGNQAASYGVKTADTLAVIATALAAQFSSPVVCSATGPSITFISGFSTIAARSAAPQQAAQEVERLQKRFQITIWAATDALRNTIGAALRPFIMGAASLPLPDGTSVRVWPVADLLDDTKQRAQGFLRDMIYMVEYPTMQGETLYPVTTIQTAAAVSEPSGAQPQIHTDPTGSTVTINI
jgi:hypothetical protein